MISMLKLYHGSATIAMGIVRLLLMKLMSMADVRLYPLMKLTSFGMVMSKTSNCISRTKKYDRPRIMNERLYRTKNYDR